MSFTDTEEELGLQTERKAAAAVVDFRRKGNTALVISRDEPIVRSVFYCVRSVSGRPYVSFGLQLPWVYYILSGSLRRDVDGSHNKDWSWAFNTVGFRGSEAASYADKLTLPHCPNMVGFTPCQAIDDPLVGEGPLMASSISNFFWSGGFNSDYHASTTPSPAVQAIRNAAAKLAGVTTPFFEEIDTAEARAAIAERFPELGKITYTEGYPRDIENLLFLMAWESLPAEALLGANVNSPQATHTKTIAGAAQSILASFK